MNNINISKDFSNIPGGRYKNEGAHSGEEFRDDILLPAFEEIEDSSEKLIINFDGCFGFGTSFLEEAFGGLVRIYKKKNVFSKIKIIANDDETIPQNIKKYIMEAEEKLK